MTTPMIFKVEDDVRKMPPITPKIERLFWSKVRIAGPDECWEWSGYTTKKGYGMTSIRFSPEKHSTFLAHRFAWIIRHGSIPNGMCVCHSCDNPPCCNPSHLWLGTTQENIKDSTSKGRRSHVTGEKNGASVLTVDDILEIRRRCDAGTYGIRPMLAKQFGVCVETIRNVAIRNFWKHIPEEKTNQLERIFP